MSKHNNTNTDHYKTAGRDPQGRNNAQHLAKEEFGKVQAAAVAKPKRKKSKAA